MGASLSTLPKDDVYQLAADTGFTHEQIEHYYKRFKRLDREGLGSLSPDDLLIIPEFAMNPLAGRIIDLLFKSRRNQISKQALLDETPRLYFQDYVKFLSLFTPATDLNQKLRFAYEVLDVNGDGKIRNDEIIIVLQSMVGSNVPEETIRTISKNVSLAFTENIDMNPIEFEKFEQVMCNSDIDALMTSIPLQHHSY